MCLPLRLISICGALSISLSACSETGGAAGAAGFGGSGGSAGSGGTDLCSTVTCNDDSECTEDFCDPADPYLCVFINEPVSSTCAFDGICDGEGTCLRCAFEDCTEARYDPTAPGSCVAVNAPEGSPCRGEDGSCDGEGNCDRCDDGNDCTSNTYDVELRACAFPNHPETYPCECNYMGFCKACDGAGDCRCTGDEQCQAECMLGGACAEITGACESGEPVRKDTLCRDGWVCDGEGACVECTTDERCEEDEDYNDCTREGRCDVETGMCMAHEPIADGTPCAGGSCSGGKCALDDSVLPCSAQGIRNSAAAGGGPYTFDCDGPTTLVTIGTITIDNDVVLDFEGNLTLDGSLDQYAFSVEYRRQVELRNVNVTRGAGISNDGVLTLENVTVSGSGSTGILNSGSLSATNIAVSDSADTGILNTIVGKMTMINGTVSNNGGPGVWNSYWLTIRNSSISGNQGHGIHNDMGPLVLVSSTVSGNEQSGVYCEGRFTIVNSTISGNLLDGISSDSPTTTNYLHNSTVSGNRERGFAIKAGLATLANSVIDGSCMGSPLMISDGHNLESPGDTCGFGKDTDQPNVGADELALTPLLDNGGPTLTHALRPGSPAIDQIAAAMCVDAYGRTISEDQRGVARPQGDACDIGAFELERP